HNPRNVVTRGAHKIGQLLMGQMDRKLYCASLRLTHWHFAEPEHFLHQPLPDFIEGKAGDCSLALEDASAKHHQQAEDHFRPVLKDSQESIHSKGSHVCSLQGDGLAFPWPFFT